MEQSMNISQISSNARQILMENRAQEEMHIISDIKSKYSYLVTMNRDRVVRTLIYKAMEGHNTAHINFDYSQFCCGIGKPSEVLRNTITRIIESDARLVGVKFSVWDNANSIDIDVNFFW